MRSNVGLWIDHRKAIVVSVTDKGEEIAVTISGVERQLRRSGGTSQALLRCGDCEHW
jgi:hypothetical protein